MRPSVDRHRVCPKPHIWHEVHTSLKAAAAELREQASLPVPLILGGWAFSNDREKQNRWRATVAWAEERGLHQLVDLPEEAYYIVAEIYSGRIGPYGGPMYLDWNFVARPLPDPGLLRTAMLRLSSNWRNVAGDELGRITTPIRFSGAKKRCLVVEADYSHQPAWGSWGRLSLVESERRSFTRLRSSINAALTPMR